MSDGHGATETYTGPMGIFFDANRNECYVADTGNHQVVVCDDKGMPIFEFYHHVSKGEERILGEPKSLVVDNDGHIFLTDNLASYVDVLDFRGRNVARIDVPDDDCGEHHRFDFLAIDAQQTVYATFSCKYRRVAVISRAHEIQRVVDLKYDDDEPVCMTGIAVDDKRNIFVTDPCAMEMVQMFDPNGKFIRGFGVHQRGKQNFSFPSGLAICDNGEMFIVDTIRQVVSRFTANGDFVGYVGGKGKGAGAFSYPSGIATDGSQRLFVVEKGGHRYQCFRFELVDEHQDQLTSFTKEVK